MILTLWSLDGCNLNKIYFVLCIAYLFFIIIILKLVSILCARCTLRGVWLIMSPLTACIIFFINKIIACAVKFVYKVNPTHSTLKSWIHPWFLVNLSFINWMCVYCVRLESLLQKAFSFKLSVDNVWFNQA